jgi:hypothetical protein
LWVVVLLKSATQRPLAVELDMNHYEYYFIFICIFTTLSILEVILK